MVAALMLIDAQRSMLEPPDPIPRAEQLERALRDLLARAREADAPVVHVQNDGGDGDPDAPGTAGWGLVFEPLAHERTVRKSVPDVFESNPALAGELQADGIDTLVLAGMQSEWCVAASARAARQAGFAVRLVSDAHATYDGASQSAEQIARDVEREARSVGVMVVPAGSVRFASPRA